MPNRARNGDVSRPLRVVAPIANKTLLGVLYLVAAVSVAGLPPLSGFIGKVALLMGVDSERIGWVWAAVLASSLLTIMGLARIGTRLFWRVEQQLPAAEVPPLRRLEIGAVVMLLGYGIAMTVAAEPVLAYARATTDQLLDAEQYIQSVRETLPLLREPAR